MNNQAALERMEWHAEKGHWKTWPLDELVDDVLSAALKDTKRPEGCNQCGGTMAHIRGRYPGSPDRKVCPTCLVETMESLVQNYPIAPEANDASA